MKYVDLGLSVLWADCNIGANTPEEYGDYYKWDDIPKGYEIPTKEQQDELRTKCDWLWTTQNGINGYKVISKVNGNSIFLPAAGFLGKCNLFDAGNSGFYWSSSPNARSSYYVYYMTFDSNYIGRYCYSRYDKNSVRPIKTKINNNNKNKTTMTLKEVNEIFPLKSGMCLELFKDGKREQLILFQYGKGKLCYTRYNLGYSWAKFDSLACLKSYDKIKVYQSPTDVSLFDELDLIFNSDDYKIKELTMQEIADKFGIKVENLRIKE